MKKEKEEHHFVYYIGNYSTFFAAKRVAASMRRKHYRRRKTLTFGIMPITEKCFKISIESKKRLPETLLETFMNELPS